MNTSKLKSDIKDAIKKNDLSCSCCGPTDIDKTTDDVIKIIIDFLQKYILKDNE